MNTTTLHHRTGQDAAVALLTQAELAALLAAPSWAAIFAWYDTTGTLHGLTLRTLAHLIGYSAAWTRTQLRRHAACQEVSQ